MDTPKKVHQHGLLALHGGAARVRQLLCRELPHLGWSVSSSCEIMDLSGDETIEDTGVGADLKQSSPTALGQAASASRICHLHSTADWQAACTSLAAQMSCLPLVVTLHDASLLDGSLLSEDTATCPVLAPGLCSERSDLFSQCGHTKGPVSSSLQALLRLRPCLISPSAWLARRLRETVGEKCRIIPNGVEPNLHDRKMARERLGLAPAAKMLLFAAHGGLLAQLKGAARWLEIWSKIKTAVPEAICFMIGGENLRHGPDFVEWPYVGREKMALLMAAADLLVYPSLADNHPLVVLEAMSAATAVSAYAVGGIPEQLRPGETGLLAPAGDEAALVSNSVRLLTAPDLLRKMGWAGHELWRRHFQAAQMAAAYSRLYEHCVQGAAS